MDFYTTFHGSRPKSVELQSIDKVIVSFEPYLKNTDTDNTVVCELARYVKLPDGTADLDTLFAEAFRLL